MYDSIRDLTTFLSAVYSAIPASVVAAFTLIMVLIIGKYLLRLLRDN